MRRAKVAAIVGVVLVACAVTAVAQENPSGPELTVQLGHSDSVESVVFSPDGRHVLTGSWDGTMRFWNAETGQEIYTTVVTPDGRSLTWTPEGYFSGDADLAREAAYFVDGMRTIDIDQFFDQYYRPDGIEASINGGM